METKNNTCNLCGDDCMVFISEDIKEFEGMELKAIWGYSSKKDGEKWFATICEKCVDKHLSKLINFTKISY